MNNQNIRHALSRIAWAYLLILLNFRINDLDLLPNWAGYLLIFLAIGQLSGELRNLPLLKPFCILLGIAAGVDWLALPLSGAELTGRFFLLSALVACVALYFHFQLLTDLALLADGPGNAPVLARRLRVCRNIDAVLQIAVTLLSTLPLPAEEAWVQLPAVLLLLFWLGTRVVIAVSLFVLRGFFPPEGTEDA